jgi:hypothetical protein
LVLLSKSYGGYAFAFVQDEYEKTQYASPKRAEAYKNRAENFYLRGKDYAMRYLSEEDSDFKEALNADFLSFEKAVKDFDEDDVPALFWGASNWGNWLNMNLDVLALDENFYYGGPHLFYGAYYAARPAMLGGNIKKAKVHFDKALKLNKRKFLIVQVLYAQYYAVQTQNKKLFRTLLKEVLTADDDIFPEQSLITQLAKRKARRLLKQQNKLF